MPDGANSPARASTCNSSTAIISRCSGTQAPIRWPCTWRRRSKNSRRPASPLLTRGRRPHLIRTRGFAPFADRAHGTHAVLGREFDAIAPSGDSRGCGRKAELAQAMIESVQFLQPVNRAQFVVDAERDRHVVPVLNPMRRARRHVNPVAREQLVLAAII